MTPLKIGEQRQHENHQFRQAIQRLRLIEQTGPKVKCKKCGAIAVDGGGHYLRILGEQENIEVLAHE
jgi:hypothetical protein